MSKTYTMNEIMAAFDTLQGGLEETWEEGAGKQQRYLISDVAHDVAILEAVAARETELAVGEAYAFCLP